MPIDSPFDRTRMPASVMRCVTENTLEGFFATDRDLRIVLWNRWMEIHSERLAAEVRGRPLVELFPDIAARGIGEYYANALEGRVTLLSHALHRYIVPLSSTNAEAGLSKMPQSGRIGPLVDDAGIIGTFTTIEDVSDRIASESELRKQIEAHQRARTTAERALRAKEDFLSTLSHEMRTPLNAVLGWARILLAREEIDKELLDRALHVIDRNASMQAQMIDDMLDMARIVAGKLRLETQPVDLLGVVLGAIDVVMPAAAAKGIAVRTSLDPKTPRVLGDQDRLQQVMWNVLTNGLKFTDPGGSIEVRLETADKAARIVVADSGHGIRADFLPHVFERFRQADTSSGRRHGGLGLGLALVRDLIELHGGSVRALSEGEGKGATFVIELPTVISPEIRRNHVDGPYGDGAAASLQEVRILLVDDESDARELALTALEHCGAEVQAVSSSAEALAVLREMPPDRLPHVIVSDIGMPREDGYDLIRQIRAMDTAHGRIPAVAVTGYATADDMNRAMAAGYQLHIAKPIDPESLIAAISQLVRPQVFVRGDRG